MGDRSGDTATRGLLSLIRMIALLLARAAVSAALLHAAPRMPLRAPRAVVRADVPQAAQVLPPYVQYATEGRVGFTSVAVCALALSNLVVQLARPSRSFATARWLFLRAFSVVACAAFLSAHSQILGLVGEQGILSAAKEVAQAKPSPSVPYGSLTVLGDASDRRLRAVCLGGAACAAASALLDGRFVRLSGAFCFLPAVLLLTCQVLYGAVRLAGGQFFQLQWDALLHEAALFAALLALPSFGPASLVVHRCARWLLIVLLFRLMLGSGLVKLASADPYWGSMRAMDFHYWTQPLPARAAKLAHVTQSRFVSSLSCAFSLVVELLGPLLFFLGPAARAVGCALQSSLQLGICATGHYGFFNILTLCMCMLLLDDSQLPSLPMGAMPASEPATALASLAMPPLVALTIVLAITQAVGLSAACQVRGRRLLAVPTPMLRVYQSLRRLGLGNSYGLFAVMTTRRQEVVIEGTSGGRVWEPYGFRYKPDGESTALKPVPPMHMPRLDWWLWFVPLGMKGRGARGRWLRQLCERLVVPSNSSHVLRLFDTERLPFPDPQRPPIAVRAVVRDYSWPENATAPFWERGAQSVIYGPVSRDDVQWGVSDWRWRETMQEALGLDD